MAEDRRDGCLRCPRPGHGPDALPFPSRKASRHRRLLAGSRSDFNAAEHPDPFARVHPGRTRPSDAVRLRQQPDGDRIYGNPIIRGDLRFVGAFPVITVKFTTGNKRVKKFRSFRECTERITFAINVNHFRLLIRWL